MKNKKLMIILKKINYQTKKQISQDKEQNKKWKKCKVRCSKAFKRLKDKNKNTLTNYKNLMNLLETKFKEQKQTIKKNLMN